MDNVAVLFKDDGSVRILHGVDPSHFQGMTNVAINPDLTAVSGIPPHLWKLANTNVVPKAAGEGAVPVPAVIEHTLTVAKSFYYTQAAIVAGVSLAVSLLVKFL
jgi:hypothetical protein